MPCDKARLDLSVGRSMVRVCKVESILSSANRNGGRCCIGGEIQNAGLPCRLQAAKAGTRLRPRFQGPSPSGYTPFGEPRYGVYPRLSNEFDAQIHVLSAPG